MSENFTPSNGAPVESSPVAETPSAPVAEGANLEQAVQQAAEAGASKEEIKQMIKEFDLKVNGKSKKVKVDLSDDKYLIQQLQKAEAFSQTAQEKAQLEKLVDQALMNAKNDPWSFLRELGLDPDDLAERRISDRIEEMKKSPEQVERENMQKELEAARKQLQKVEQEKKYAEEERRMAEMEKRQHAYETQLNNDILEALQTDPELPKSRRTAMKIADALVWALDNGFPDATVKDILPTVKAELQAELSEMFDNMGDEVLEKWIGNKTAERMRKKRLASVKAAQATASNVENIKSVAQPAPKKEEKKDRVKASDFFRSLK